MKTLSAFILAGSMLVGTTAMAEGNSLRDGTKSLSFSVPNGGNGYASGAFGYWMTMMGGQMNIGANVGLAFANKPETNWDLLLAPALRYYMSNEGAIAPFFFGQLNFRIYDDGIDGNDDDPELSLAGGLGVEWFVTEVFSVAGQTGLALNVLQPGGSDAGMALGTFMSTLTAQIYFE